jgi:hypothetical protein
VEAWPGREWRDSAAVHDPDQPLEVVSAINPMAACATHWLWKQASFFAIPDRRHIAASLLGQRPDV